LLLGAMGRALNGHTLNLQSLGSLGGHSATGSWWLLSIRTGREDRPGSVNINWVNFSRWRGGSFWCLPASPLSSLWRCPALYLDRQPNYNHDPGCGIVCRFSVGSSRSPVVLVMLNSYASSLSYGCGNGTVAHYSRIFTPARHAPYSDFLARHHFPLWIISLPWSCHRPRHVGLELLLRAYSHPALGALLPVKLDLAKSGVFWGKAYGFISIAPLLASTYSPINSWSVTISDQEWCRFMFIIGSCASSPHLPSIVPAWLVCQKSPNGSRRPKLPDQERARHETKRLSSFQIILGCAAALVYLTMNDSFVIFGSGAIFRRHSALRWPLPPCS